eukprot:CAMPEP_0206256656 /NCGR_PEP_ID=MMETSP0047_2-20121206/24897_1 /ASSEMBLY_ACC=CAM_ASM_000192 /TAXON_ID=195065 /ORGANISM="Chroomonas mesostigmatica_cf, Strain CCMP1168" /LENGTH=135 /DNA_ID=CAMNT_0053683137 /DNA_START=1155 /DNA_END=1561 /DNA_ORIENTATION=-
MSSAAECVASSTKISPAPAFPISLAAMLTMLPIAHISLLLSLPTKPEYAVPVVIPMLTPTPSSVSASRIPMAASTPQRGSLSLGSAGSIPITANSHEPLVVLQALPHRPLARVHSILNGEKGIVRLLHGLARRGP